MSKGSSSHNISKSCSMKKPRKGESGAQLLARLSSHADLSCIDPYVFSKITSSTPSTLLTSSSSGTIIEIYGSEGIGKTEMVLHYIAKVCLPHHWKEHSLNGLGAKVIFIDTEFKFSVLRFATILEKQVVTINEKLKQKYRDSCETASLLNTNCSSFVNGKTASPLDGKTVSPLDGKTVSPLKNLDTNNEKVCLPVVDCFTSMHQNSVSTIHTDTGGGEVELNRSGEDSATAGRSNDCCTNKPPDCRGKELETQAATNPPLTAQDVEDIVQDALGRVQVMHVLSSGQLLISLLSLETSLSNDSAISVIVIDAVSAFYWVDKLEDLENPLCTDLKMAPIASVISKYASEFGITFLVIKSALISNKRPWNEERDNSKNGYSASSSDAQSEKVNRKEKALHEHVEFLGKSWSSLNKKRLVLTRSVDMVGRVSRAVWCNDWPDCRVFTCTDDGLQFL